jgi:hypothetical protein
MRRDRHCRDCRRLADPRKLAAAHGAALAGRALRLLFLATSIVCLAWPRPFIVALELMAFAGLLEALQGLTPDRVPDLPTALSGAAGVLSAALLAKLLAKSRKLALARPRQI